MTPRKATTPSSPQSVSGQSAQILDALLRIQENLRRILEMIDGAIAIAREHNSGLEELARDLQRIAQWTSGGVTSDTRDDQEALQIEGPPSLREESPPFAMESIRGLGNHGDDSEDLVPIL